MENLSTDFKKAVAEGLLSLIQERQSINHAFYKFYGISDTNCQKIRLNRLDEVRMTDNEWLRLGRKLDVNTINSKWQAARTDVFITIEEDILFCKEYAKAKICVDECGIGKTFAAKYLSKKVRNCFYVDASQGKTLLSFTRNLSKALGFDPDSRVIDMKEDIKTYLKMIESPVVIIDEAGDLSAQVLMEIKEYWNATEGYCGWYLMGADGLKYIIEKGIKARKPGYKEIFSRFSERYTTTVPDFKDDRILFYRKLITDVLLANGVEKSRIDEIVRRCLVQTADGKISGLRRAESLLQIYTRDDNQNKLTHAITEENDSIVETESQAAVC
jgi:DNA transposition AAA+ family ATPase